MFLIFVVTSPLSYICRCYIRYHKCLFKNLNRQFIVVSQKMLLQFLIKKLLQHLIAECKQKVFYYLTNYVIQTDPFIVYALVALIICHYQVMVHKYR